MERGKSFRRPTGQRLLVCCLALTTTFAARGAMQSATGPRAAANAARLPTIQFNRDIRPILSANCLACHGPDKTHRATPFHFDVEESAKQDLGEAVLQWWPATRRRAS